MIKVNQKTIIDFIDEFISQNGYSPSINDIAEGLGFSFNNVAYHIKTLTVKGYLSYIPGKQRTIRVVKHHEQEAV